LFQPKLNALAVKHFSCFSQSQSLFARQASGWGEINNMCR